MKWLSPRYAYPLVTVTLFVSIALQAAWITQLVKAQRTQVKQELELLVSEASKNTIYHSILPGHEQSARFREFFLSPEWLSLRQAFDDLKVDNLHSQFHYGITNDSSVVEMRLSFLNDASKRTDHRSPGAKTDGETAVQTDLADKYNLHQMDILVHKKLTLSGFDTKTGLAVYDYNNDHLISRSIPKTNNPASFVSKRYTYNLKFLRKYQLIVPSLTVIILYRMRYYLLSSLVMILLTGGAFYLILKLLRNQRLYTEARVTFISNMTHELKTPVATVAVALESIKKYDLINDPEKLKTYLDISGYELQRLNLMIEKVLNSEQVDRGDIALQTELYDVQLGVEQVIASLKLQADQSGASVTMRPFAEPCFVNGDPMHLVNVFYNLVDNALKYGGQGVKIDIRITCDAQYVTLSFKDNGPGIAGFYHKRVFERFFRVMDNTDVHNVKGSGLGLHYVKQVVEKHGGRIKLVSEPGKGSNFMIDLPAYNEA